MKVIGGSRMGLLLAVIVLTVVAVSIALTCEMSSSCTNTTLLRLENESGGWNNAHAQLLSYVGVPYANSICCDSQLVLGTSCVTGVPFLELSADSNAHVQQASDLGKYSYDNEACISSSQGNFTCGLYNTTCPAFHTCLASMASSEGDHTTNAHLGACSTYTLKVCCTPIPGVPTLIEPANGDANVFSRYTDFDWSDVTTSSGSTRYEINITAPGGCAAIPVRNTSTSNYTSVEELCVDKNYSWSVRACDDNDVCGDWATAFTFNITSVVNITLTTNSTDFGSMNPSLATQDYSNDTLDDDPAPMVVANGGNVDVDIDLKGLDDLWTLQSLGTSYFQFADEDQTTFLNVSLSYQNLTETLAYSTSSEIEFNVTSPIAEPPGSKSSIVQILAEAS